MEDLISMVANVVFPIVVTMYILLRIEGKMENLTNAINALIVTIKKD